MQLVLHVRSEETVPGALCPYPVGQKVDTFVQNNTFPGLNLTSVIHVTPQTRSEDDVAGTLRPVPLRQVIDTGLHAESTEPLA